MRFTVVDLFDSTAQTRRGRVEDPENGSRMCTGYKGAPCVIGPVMQPIEEFTDDGSGRNRRRWQCRSCDNENRRDRAQAESDDLAAQRNAEMYKRFGGPYCTYERWYRQRTQHAAYYGSSANFARRDREHRTGNVDATQFQETHAGWLLLCVVPHWHDTREAALRHEQQLYDLHVERHGDDVRLLNRVRPQGAPAEQTPSAA